MKVCSLLSTAFILLVCGSYGPRSTHGLLVRNKGPNRRPSVNGGAAHPRFAAPAKHGVQGDLRQFMTPTVTVGQSVQTAAATLWASPGKSVTFLKELAKVLHWQGFSFFFAMGWFLVPLMEKPYNYFQDNFLLKNKIKNESNSNPNQAPKPYQQSKFHALVDHVAQASKIAFSVYVVDTLRIALQAWGVTSIPQLALIPRAYMRVAYTFWGVDRIASLKRHFVAHKTNSHPERLPTKVQYLNRAVDVALYSSGFFVATAAVKADLGTAAKGFVALGSFGTLDPCH